MKQSAWKKFAAVAIMAVTLTGTAIAVTAASPIPSKTKSPDASSSIYSSESTSTAKASSTAGSKSSSTAKSTSSAKSSSTAKTSASPETSQEPAQESAQVSASPEAVMNVVTSQDQLDAKKYLSKSGAFGWFLLTVLVSAIISFLISYRFYKMVRKDNHLAAEIRALRKDIDTKMQGTIGGFSEYETKITNSNPGYARHRTNIKTTAEEESDDEKAQEIYKKWETQILSSKEREGSDVKSTRRSSRQDSEYDEEENIKGTSVKDKVKGVFDDFFNNK